MGKKTKPRKPFDPAEQARKRAEQEKATRRDPGRWSVNREAMALPANRDVKAEEGTRTKVERIKRFDVFALMAARAPKDRPFPILAVERLENDIATLHRTSGDRGLDRVDNGSAIAGALSRARLEAGEKLAEVSTKVGTRPWRLLMALIEPAAIHGSHNNWRGVVQSVTGEISHDGQAALVRDACEALAEVYRAIDNTPKVKKVAA